MNTEELSVRPCPVCGGEVLVSEVESPCGGYIDCKYRCNDCEYIFWVDGIDS